MNGHNTPHLYNGLASIRQRGTEEFISELLSAADLVATRGGGRNTFLATLIGLAKTASDELMKSP